MSHASAVRVVREPHTALSTFSIDSSRFLRCRYPGTASGTYMYVPRLVPIPVLGLGSYLPWFLNVKMTGKMVGEAIFPSKALLSILETKFTKFLNKRYILIWIVWANAVFGASLPLFVLTVFLHILQKYLYDCVVFWIRIGENRWYPDRKSSFLTDAVTAASDRHTVPHPATGWRGKNAATWCSRGAEPKMVRKSSWKVAGKFGVSRYS